MYIKKGSKEVNLSINKKLFLLSFRFKVLIAACLFVNLGFANTYYVSTAGNDTLDSSYANPFRTIFKAVTVLNPGDRVLVFGGNYSERASYNRVCDMCILRRG